MLNYIENELSNRSTTENGAVGYSSTGSALLDLNYSVSSLRRASEEEIISLFDKAFKEHKEYAIKWLFFARDVRGGLGERRLFRICYRRLAELDLKAFCVNLPIISEYGRYDDLISLLGISETTDTHIMAVIQTVLTTDIVNMRNNKPVSLLAKWLPSENASSKKTKELARTVRIYLKLSSKDYRKLLSSLRKHLDVVEVKMCANEWERIDYEKVPSLANLKYRNAFMKHDVARRKEYLESLSEGNAKINMSVASPVDIVSEYCDSQYWFREKIKKYDELLELAWKNLKGITISDTLVVADGSGSMTRLISGSITALDVANALAIYTSEHNTGIYNNKYITFSSQPQFVSFNEEDTLRKKLITAFAHDECSNTNIHAVFQLILFVAIKHKIPQEEMIKNILIISDMEFDYAQKGGWRWKSSPLTPRLFEQIREEYERYGYDLPRLIFWNVASTTKTIPVTENKLGVVLVSGFSQNALKMVLSNKFDPYEVLIEQITSPRYDLIRIN